jgi:hypothetical protein
MKSLIGLNSLVGRRRNGPRLPEVVTVPGGSFDRVIEEHLELQRRNRSLELSMPISRYRDDVVAERTDSSLASRGVATEILELDPPTETLVRRQTPAWDDPDSWWNVDETGGS